MSTPPSPKEKRAMESAWPTSLGRWSLLGHPPWAVMEYLRDFRTVLLKGDLEEYMAKGRLWIEHPDTCNCTKREESDPDLLTWIHANHRKFNGVCWLLIAQTIGLSAFREILERDLAVQDSDLEPERGRLLDEEHARGLMRNFFYGNAWK